MPWLLFFIVLFAPAAAAHQIHPISVTNTRPTVLVQGLPNSRDPQLVARGSWDIKLDYEVTSQFSHDKASNERVLFDGEIRRVSVSTSAGLTHNTHVKLIVPFIEHDGGSLDQFIEDWHDFFGLPQNGRDLSARNRLLYYYEKDGKVLLNFTEPVSGVGDVQLIMATRINAAWLPDQHNLVFNTAIKFPTGDSDKLTGSGGAALSAWFAGDMKTRWFNHEGMTYVSAGAMAMQRGDVIPDQQRSLVVFGGIGSGVKVADRVVLQAQLDMHSPFYKESQFIEIDSAAFQLTMGGNIKGSHHWDMDIGVTEDLLPHASPDVIFHIGLNSHW